MNDSLLSQVWPILNKLMLFLQFSTLIFSIYFYGFYDIVGAETGILAESEANKDVFVFVVPETWFDLQLF